MEATVVRLRNEGFRVRVVDVRAQPTIAWRYKIRSVPTFVYEINGEEIRRRTGRLSLASLRQMYRQPLF